MTSTVKAKTSPTDFGKNEQKYPYVSGDKWSILSPLDAHANQQTEKDKRCLKKLASGILIQTCSSSIACLLFIVE